PILDGATHLKSFKLLNALSKRHATPGGNTSRFLGLRSRGPIAVSAASMTLLTRLSVSVSTGAGSAVDSMGGVVVSRRIPLDKLGLVANVVIDRWAEGQNDTAGASRRSSSPQGRPSGRHQCRRAPPALAWSGLAAPPAPAHP